MQVIHFQTGGFVVHKLTIPGRPFHYSAWFDNTGRLLDAESVRPSDRRTFTVRGGREVSEALTDIGRKVAARTHRK